MSKQTDLINIPNTITVDGTRIGIGTDSPTGKLTVRSGTGQGEALTISSSSSGGNYVTHKHYSSGVIAYTGAGGGAAVGAGTSNDYAIRAESGSLIFATGGNNERARLDSDGLKFHGDTAAANALDDYEYGSWTPTTPNGGSVTANNAVYTKIGDQVTVWCLLQNFTDRSTATSLTVKGLPFTTTNEGVAVGTCMCQYVAREVHTIYMASGSGLQFYKSENGTGFVVLNHSDLQNSSAQIYLMATYTAA